MPEDNILDVRCKLDDDTGVEKVVLYIVIRDKNNNLHRRRIDDMIPVGNKTYYYTSANAKHDADDDLKAYFWARVFVKRRGRSWEYYLGGRSPDHYKV